MSRRAGQPGQAGLVLERRRASSCGRHALALEQPQQQAGVDAARAGRHDQALERREAHRRVDGPRRPRTAASDAPAPRWQVTTRRSATAPEQLGGPARGVGVREPVEAVAAQRPALAPLRRAARRCAPAAGSVAWKAVSKQATCGHVGQQRARTASSPASDLGWCSGARSVERLELRDHAVVDRARRRVKRSPPCTTRWPTASTVAQPSSRAVDQRRRRRPPGAGEVGRVHDARRPRRAAAASGCSTRR